MADNFVQIKIKATDTAKPDLASLKLKLDELGSKVESAKVDVNDADATAKILALNAKLAALNKQAANPKITVAGAARVEAQAAAIDAQLKHMDEDARKAADSTGTLKSRLLALGSTAGVISGVGDAFSLFNKDAGMGTKIMSGLSLATGLLEAPLSGAIVGIGGLAAGLAAAGTGMLAFGAVAKSNYTVASTAAKQVQSAQIAYNAAIATGAKHSTAYAAEQKAILKAYAQLSPAQIALSKQIGNAQNSWQSFVQSNTTGVSKIMSQGIGLLPKIFASMQPFMAPVEKAIGGLVGQMGKGLNSSGFKSFIDMLANNAGPAITKLGQSIGHIGVGLGGIIRAFMPMSQTVLGGVDKMTAAFAKWGSSLSGHTGFQSLMAMAKADMPLVGQLAKNLGGAIKNLGGAMTGLSTPANSKALLQLAVPLAQLVNSLSKSNPALLRFGLYALAAGGAAKKMAPAVQGIKGAIDGIKGGASAIQNLSKGFSDSASAASSATGVWGSIGGKLSSAISAVRSWGVGAKIASAATRVWTAVQAAFNVVMAMNPLTLIIIAIAALVAAIIILTMKSKAFRDFWKAVWHDIASIFDTVRHAIARGFDFITHAASTAFNWVKAHWPLILAILTGPIGLAVYFIVSHWQKILDGAKNMINAVVSFFKGLPGRILSGLGNIGSLLFNAGKNVIQGLINGISSMIGGVTHAIGSVVSEITSHLPFSPAKKGPLSGRGSPDQAGKRIAQMLGQGMSSGLPSVTAAAARLAGGASVGGGAGGAGGGGGGTLTLRIQGGGTGLDALFMTWLKQAVRTQGGDPNMFQRKVAFA